MENRLSLRPLAKPGIAPGIAMHEDEDRSSHATSAHMYQKGSQCHLSESTATSVRLQAAAAARQAAGHYQLFLASLTPGGSDPGPGGSVSWGYGQLPDPLPADDEAHAVRAAFNAGCLLNTAVRLGGGRACGGAAGRDAGVGGDGGCVGGLLPARVLTVLRAALRFSVRLFISINACPATLGHRAPKQPPCPSLFSQILTQLLGRCVGLQLSLTLAIKLLFFHRPASRLTQGPTACPRAPRRRRCGGWRRTSRATV
jgi:hypothetical protein